MKKGNKRKFYCLRCGQYIGARTYYNNEYHADLSCPSCDFLFTVIIEAGDKFPNKANIEWGNDVLEKYYCPFDGKGKMPENNILKEIKDSKSDYNFRCVNQACKREFGIYRD